MTICVDCGREVSTKKTLRCKSCSNHNRRGTYNCNTPRGTYSSSWKGGVIIRRGYFMRFDILKRRYYPEHRFIMENFLGRHLNDNEIVHHINGNTLDNRIENLGLFPDDSLHATLHSSRRDTWR